MEYTYKYPRPAVTADCVVMTVGEDPQILLIERGSEPYKGCWAFPGGFLNMDETTEECAIRELKEETGLEITKVHQIGAYSAVDRDPRGRTITVAYLALMEHAEEVKGQDDAAKAQWFPINELPKLAFDHEKILNDALLLYLKLKDTIPAKKKMDYMDKVEMLVSAMSHAMLERFKLMDGVNINITVVATAQMFARSTLSVMQNSRNPSKTLDLCIGMLEDTFNIEFKETLIKMNEDSIKELKETIQKNNIEIERRKMELLEKRAKKAKDSDVN